LQTLLTTHPSNPIVYASPTFGGTPLLDSANLTAGSSTIPLARTSIDLLVIASLASTGVRESVGKVALISQQLIRTITIVYVSVSQVFLSKQMAAGGTAPVS